MKNTWQLILENEWVSLVPIGSGDFEKLFEVAADPEIWEQHPEPDRYQKDVFRSFFETALTANGSFVIYEKVGGTLIGSSRFYDYDPAKKEIFIGYTFLAKAFWGGKLNGSIKKLMMDYAFQFVDTILFNVGIKNIRSQKAMEKIGGRMIKETNDKITYALSRV